MKKRNKIQLLGIVSIVILIAVQIYLITSIWNQKDEMFALRYTMRSQEAMNFINWRIRTDGLDTVRFILSKYSEQVNKKLFTVRDKDSIDVMKKEILEYFTNVVNQEQDLSLLLSTYFERRGFEKDFKHKIVVNDLEMISFDTIVVYRSEDFMNRRLTRGSERQPAPEIQKSKILVNRFRMEDNNYRFFFEYYIDFSDKRKLILKETSAALAMSIFSILAVVILFMITFRNLMEEKRLSELKTDFINNMTHELKTPLSTITVAGKTLEMQQIRTNEEKILETARLINKQSVHLNQLINIILEISMWERTQFQLDKKKVRIEELMDDIVDSFRTGGGNNATINKKYNFSNSSADLDIVYFTTLVNNLLSNAVKYSDRDPVIDVEGFISDNNLTVSIKDNGIGISKTDQKHIFEKFYRASTGNIHKYKGLGLGLYYVKKIAEAHGGDVTVTSKPGKGSIFTVTIPN
jgi:signal transduction histidine kinase